jgi:hypothetical protein
VVAWDIVYYKTANGDIPAVDFLVGCPTKVRANMLAVLDAVAEGPAAILFGWRQNQLQYAAGREWLVIAAWSATER